MKILITGGAGYIGSHTCVELLLQGHQVTVYDNFINSSVVSLHNVMKISGIDLRIIEGDLRHQEHLTQILQSEVYESVIHFAGLKSVAESQREPQKYYDFNIVGTLSLLKAMQKSGLKKLIFSSSATVYGTPEKLPIPETHPLSANSTYGRSKLFIEEILRDVYSSDTDWSIVILRYFNPVGAHESGLIGEDPKRISNNLMPIISQVAIGRLPSLSVWGSDYPTRDGTGIRDYIHVTDLALAHIQSLNLLGTPMCIPINLGTGVGYSVIEMINAFEKSSDRKIYYEIQSRRDGDVPACYADVRLAKDILGWRAERNLEDMCKSYWKWQMLHPEGYQ